MQERIQAATRALKEGRHAQALCLEILSQHPQALPAWIIAGLSAAAQQDLATAELLFRRAVPLESPPGTATLQLARLLMASGRWSEALPLLGRLCVPVPRDAASITIHLHYAEALRGFSASSGSRNGPTPFGAVSTKICPVSTRIPGF